MQLRVDSSLSQQFLMHANLCDALLVAHDNATGLPGHRKTVCGHDRSAPRQQSGKRVVNIRLGLRSLLALASEPDIAELDARLPAWHLRLWLRLSLGCRIGRARVKQLEDAFGPRHRGLRHVVFSGQIPNRPEYTHTVLQECQQHALGKKMRHLKKF